MFKRVQTSKEGSILPVNGLQHKKNKTAIAEKCHNKQKSNMNVIFLQDLGMTTITVYVKNSSPDSTLPTT